MVQLIQRFLKLESAGGILLLFSAAVAMLLANSPLSNQYNDFLNLPVSLQIGSFSINKTLIHWINDGFMAVFFVLVGMEVKKELFEGALSSYQQAIFPACLHWFIGLLQNRILALQMAGLFLWRLISLLRLESWHY